jgi:hypothetical protein
MQIVELTGLSWPAVRTAIDRPIVLKLKLARLATGGA